MLRRYEQISGRFWMSRPGRLFEGGVNKMKRISFDLRFVNKNFYDLIPGKIHTIRENYKYWERFEGQEVELFYWEGKPYWSKQKVFCVKRIISVQEVTKSEANYFRLSPYDESAISINAVAKNDGFKDQHELIDWFKNYKFGKMAIIHFTDFRY
jgi:hypothetical protein